jgi:hypothetical protein
MKSVENIYIIMSEIPVFSDSIKALHNRHLNSIHLIFNLHIPLNPGIQTSTARTQAKIYKRSVAKLPFHSWLSLPSHISWHWTAAEFYNRTPTTHHYTAVEFYNHTPTIHHYTAVEFYIFPPRITTLLCCWTLQSHSHHTSLHCCWILQSYSYHTSLHCCWILHIPTTYHYSLHFCAVEFYNHTPTTHHYTAVEFTTLLLNSTITLPPHITTLLLNSTTTLPPLSLPKSQWSSKTSTTTFLCEVWSINAPFCVSKETWTLTVSYSVTCWVC